MSKKFKGKKCAYCEKNLSVTADHVFAREFFLIDKRQNLPQVPSCKKCNNEKSKLEHYLTTLLPFGGRHPDAKENLKGMVPKRLARNIKLHKKIADERTYILTTSSSGIVKPSMAIPIDFESITKLFEFIVRGLSFYHWDIYLDENVLVKVMALTSAGEEFFQKRFFDLNTKARVVGKLSEHTFWYEGVQRVDCSQITAWRFSVYNGLKLGGDPKAPDETASLFGAYSGPRHLFEGAEEIAKLNKSIQATECYLEA